jgi:hypothetical protein
MASKHMFSTVCGCMAIRAMSAVMTATSGAIFIRTSDKTVRPVLASSSVPFPLWARWLSPGSRTHPGLSWVALRAHRFFGAFPGFADSPGAILGRPSGSWDPTDETRGLRPWGGRDARAPSGRRDASRPAGGTPALPGAAKKKKRAGQPPEPCDSMAGFSQRGLE